MTGIEFSKYKTIWHSYRGSDDKSSIYMDGKYYMVKYTIDQRSSVISEYIGSHIMQSVGLAAQNTMLGFWKGNLAVACENFCEDGTELHEFSWYMKDVIPSKQIGRIPTYE